MATTTKLIKMTIQFRRDTNANWLLHKDIIPAAGEPCFDLDLGTLKVGDGKKTYEQLDVIGGGVVSADGKSIVLKDNVFKLAGLEGAAVGAQIRKAADGSIEWFVPSNEAVATLQAAVAGLQSDVGTIKSDVSGLKSGHGTLLSRIEAVEGEVNVLNGDDTIEGSILKIVKDEIKAWASDVTNNETVDTIQELFDYVVKHGGEAATMAADIAALKEKVGEKTVSAQIDAAVSKKVDKVDGMGLSSNDFTDTLLAKLNSIEDNAQENVIEKISVGGVVLEIVGKTAEIPVAKIDKVGVVKSATGANKVNISDDGTMSVNKVSFESLVVPIGYEVVIDGGSSSSDDPVYPTRIGNIGYDSIADAVAHADNGDIITLQEDVNMGAGDTDHLVVNAENVTIDLGGKELVANGSNGAVKVEGGIAVLEGAGAVNATLGSDKYSMAVWCDSGAVVINDGLYSNATDDSARGTDLIYASNTGCIEINGGTFEAAKPEWTLNVRDVDYKAGTAKIVVKGGKFKNFDPANNNAEGAGTNFVAAGYKSVKEGDYYVVKPL